jgi:lysophospholipase L1-like esterase
VTALRRFERYVAIGDSTVEGLDDPLGNGRYRGWADRLAGRIAAAQGSVLYANLGVRGRTTRQVRDEQLAAAVAMSPDLAAVVSGVNDLLRRHFDALSLRGDMEAMQAQLVAGGATVITFTLPDLSGIIPMARLIRERVFLMNDTIRAAAAATGAIVCDLAHYPVAADPRLWSDDRLHANSAGHARIAEALAFHLGIPGASASWSDPLPGDPPGGFAQFVRGEAAWIRIHLLPWIWRHLHGRSSGDGIEAKFPRLVEVVSPGS